MIDCSLTDNMAFQVPLFASLMLPDFESSSLMGRSEYRKAEDSSFCEPPVPSSKTPPSEATKQELLATYMRAQYAPKCLCCEKAVPRCVAPVLTLKLRVVEECAAIDQLDCRVAEGLIQKK